MDAQTLLSSPGVGFFTMLLIGVIAGWIAEKATSSDQGLLTNLVVGIIGSVIGGYLAQALGIPVFGFIRTLISSSIGAIILLFVWRAIRSRG